MKWNKKISLILAAGMMTSLVACGEEKQQESSNFVPGTYEATVSSVGGPMTVSVTVNENAITDVAVLEEHDTDGVADTALTRIPRQVVENQTVNVDSVSGATLTSMFLKDAIKEALGKATEDLSAFEAAAHYEANAQTDMDADVVVVGGGFAGLTAAITAAKQNLKVVLLEKLSYLGGNSLVSDQLVLIAGVEPVISQWGTMATDLASYGVNISLSDFPGIGEGTWLIATNQSETTLANTIVNDLKKVAEENGVKIMTDTPAVGLLTEDGTVVGVTAQPKGQDEFTIRADAVILATGGFANNSELVSEYLPYASGARYAGTPGAEGDALEWVKAVDGKYVMLDADASAFYSVAPSTNNRTVWGMVSAHFVDQTGSLITEDQYYNTGSMAVYQTVGTEHYYAISSQTMVNASGSQSEFDKMTLAGSVVKVEGIAELEKTFGMENVKETLSALGYADDEVFYVGESVAAIYGTYGGIAIDLNCRVLNNSEEAINGLYACGEVTGSRAYQETGVYGGALGNAMCLGYVAAQTVSADLGAD